MRIKTYESYGVDRDMELVEDIFQEIYDKYKIKKIPSDKVATDFMTRVEDNFGVLNTFTLVLFKL